MFGAPAFVAYATLSFLLVVVDIVVTIIFRLRAIFGRMPPLAAFVTNQIFISLLIHMFVAAGTGECGIFGATIFFGYFQFGFMAFFAFWFAFHFWIIRRV